MSEEPSPTHPAQHPDPACLSKPGRDWSDEEFWQVYEWFNHGHRRDTLLRYASSFVFHTCHYRTNGTDLVDLWDEFLSLLDGLRRNYDPAKGDPFSYANKIFKRHSARFIRKKLRHEPYELSGGESQESFVNPKVVASQVDVTSAEERAMELTFKYLIPKLPELFGQLAGQGKRVVDRRLRVIRKFYLENKSTSRISEEERLTRSTVKKDLVEGRTLLRAEIDRESS